MNIQSEIIDMYMNFEYYWEVKTEQRNCKQFHDARSQEDSRKV